MRRFAAGFALVFAFAAIAIAKDPPQKRLQEVTIAEGTYHLELPARFKPDAPVPVLVFLHGKTVDPNADNAKGQLTNEFVVQMKALGYVAVCPVMPKEHRPHWWENGGSFEFVDAVMKDVSARVKVAWVVCAGFSAGANYSMILHQDAQRHRWFAGFLVMAGGGYLNARPAEVQKRKPVWLGCGDSDTDTYSDTLDTTGGARKAAQDLKAAGFDADHEEFPRTGHTMTAPMVAAALKWVARRTPAFQACGAVDAATGAASPERRVEALRLLAALGAADPGEYWKKQVEDARAALLAAARKDVADAAALADPAAAKKALQELARVYKGTPVEAEAKSALSR